MSRHHCPAPDCTRTIPDRLLACAYHWGQVTQATQDAVYAAYRIHGVGSAQHTAAITRAIQEMHPDSGDAP